MQENMKKQINPHTSAWYSYVSAGGVADESEAAAVDSYRLPKNRPFFKFNRVEESLTLDFPVPNTEYHLSLLSFSPTYTIEIYKTPKIN